MEPALKQGDVGCGRRATLGGAAEYGTPAAVTTSTDTRDTRQYAVIWQKPPGYCWRTSFNVPGPLFLA